METLLLVDDDVSLLESLSMHFEEAEKDGEPRFQVVTATTAAAGLPRRAECAPALVVLDMMLPDRSGLDLIEEMKSVCGDAPIVLVTAYHDMETHHPGDEARGVRLHPQALLGSGGAGSGRQPRAQRPAAQPPRGERRSGHRPGPAGRPRRPDPGDAAAGEGDWQGRRRAPRHGAGHRRVRDRQGAGRPGHPQLLLRRAAPLRGHQLLGHRRDPARVRAVRPRARRVHRRDGEQAGQVRGGRGRDGVPRRDRRHVAPRSRPSCSASSRRGSSSASAGRSASSSRRGSSPRPTATWPRR